MEDVVETQSKEIIRKYHLDTRQAISKGCSSNHVALVLIEENGIPQIQLIPPPNNGVAPIYTLKTARKNPLESFKQYDYYLRNGAYLKHHQGKIRLVKPKTLEALTSH